MGHEPSMNARASSVKSLEALYSLIVALALTTAVASVVDPDASPIPLKSDLVPLLVAFVVTLLPFYHGATRHLEATYIESKVQTKAGALMADFVGLFIESGILLVLGALIVDAEKFGWAMVTLLGFDAVWALFAHYGFSSGDKKSAEIRWSLTNIFASGLLALWLVLAVAVEPKNGTGEASRFVQERVGEERETAAVFWAGILVMSILRTVVDYALSWSFYYPSSGEDTP